MDNRLGKEAIRIGPTCNDVDEARRQWRYNRSTWPPVALAHRLTDCDDQATRRARPISAAIETYVAPCKQNASESFIASCLCGGPRLNGQREQSVVCAAKCSIRRQYVHIEARGVLKVTLYDHVTAVPCEWRLDQWTAAVVGT